MFAAALLATACGSPPPKPVQKDVVDLEEPRPSGLAAGTTQTESFVGLTGSLRMQWRTKNEAPKGAGTFRLILQSAISGRPLQEPVDEKGQWRWAPPTRPTIRACSTSWSNPPNVRLMVVHRRRGALRQTALLSYGGRLGECLKAAKELGALGLSTTVADARFAKPLDVDLLLQLARDHEVLVTIEEGSVGGFGSYVMQALSDNGVFDRGLKMRSMVLPDTFIDQDSPAAMYAAAGLDTRAIVAKVFEALGKDAAAETVKLA